METIAEGIAAYVKAMDPNIVNQQIEWLEEYIFDKIEEALMQEDYFLDYDNLKWVKR